MTAVFNAPESGDSSVANEARTSDAPQFDLRTLYSDMSATARGGSSNRESGNQIDFGVESLYSRASDGQNNSGNTFNMDQQNAMDVARRFASFDDNGNNSNNINLDREDVGRLVEVYGDMYNMQNSLQEGDKCKAEDWLHEMRRDLTSFTRGLFNDQEGDNNEDCPENPGSDGSGDNHEGGHDDHQGGNDGEGGGHEGESGPEEGHDEGNEEGNEHSEDCEFNNGQPDSGSEGYTPEDSMVLLQNDMQQLSEALASGDQEAVQRIMGRINRHLALLMRQLNSKGGSGGQDGGDGDGGEPDLGLFPFPGGWHGTEPNQGLPNPGDIFPGLPNPSDILPGLPNPGDIFPGLPNPSDILPGLPNPGDIFPGLPNPSDILPGLPNPGDIFPGLPNPRDILPGLPNPGNFFDIF